MHEHQGLLLFENQCGHIIGVEEVAGNSLEFFGGDGVDATEEGIEVAFVSMVHLRVVPGHLAPPRVLCSWYSSSTRRMPRHRS